MKEEPITIIHARILGADKLPRDRWDRLVVYAWAYQKPVQEVLHLYNTEYRRVYPSDAIFSLNEMSHIKGATDNEN